MHDIAEFLRGREPLEDLDEEALERIAGHTEVEFFPAGTVIFDQGASPREQVRIVRRGSVELIDGTQVLDELREGEFFGHPSMLTGEPTGFAARAAEDTLCYRIEADDILPLLIRPAGLRYVAKVMRHRNALLGAAPPAVASRLETRRVASSLGRRFVECGPDVSVRGVSQQMSEADVACAVIRLEDGYGIVTDHDLRSRVIAAGRSFEVPVGEVMTAPALVSDPEVTFSDAVLMMIEHGVRHLPIVEPGGGVLGVLRDVDLLAAESQTSFTLRREIAAARSPAELSELSARLPEMLIALHDAASSAPQISRVHSAVADALILRQLQLIAAAHGRPRLIPLWLALGSHGRRELAPGSDLDSAVTWPQATGAEDEGVLREVARETVDSLHVPGAAADRHGANAGSRLFARSLESWRTAVRGWATEPSADKVPVVLSALLDGRPIGTGPAWSEAIVAELTNPDARRELERWLLRLALGHRLPGGLLRNRVPDPTGARRQFDVKRDGLQPIVDLARYAGFVVDAGRLSTPARLRAGGAEGLLREVDVQLLIEAHEFFGDLRVSRHIELLRAGSEVDDSIDPAELTALTRGYVRDAFRLVAGVQRRMDERLRS